MADDAIRSYLEERAAFERLNAETTEFFARLHGYISYFRKPEWNTPGWKNLAISNLGILFPTGSTSYSIDGKTWPSAQEIGERLSSWQFARENLDNKWNSIPNDLRGGLQPPPK